MIHSTSKKILLKGYININFIICSKLTPLNLKENNEVRSVKLKMI